MPLINKEGNMGKSSNRGYNQGRPKRDEDEEDYDDDDIYKRQEC